MSSTNSEKIVRFLDFVLDGIELDFYHDPTKFMQN